MLSASSESSEAGLRDRPQKSPGCLSGCLMMPARLIHKARYLIAAVLLSSVLGDSSPDILEGSSVQIPDVHSSEDLMDRGIPVEELQTPMLNFLSVQVMTGEATPGVLNASFQEIGGFLPPDTKVTYLQSTAEEQGLSAEIAHPDTPVTVVQLGPLQRMLGKRVLLVLPDQRIYAY